MRRGILCGLLLFACAEGRDRPLTDAGARDGGSTADTGVTDGGQTDAGQVDSGVTPTGICVRRDCLDRVTDRTEWSFLAGADISTTRCDLKERVLFVMPKDPGSATLGTAVFIDTDKHRTVYGFLRDQMADLFPNLDAGEYFHQFDRDDTSEYVVGQIFRREQGGYAFAVETTGYFMGPLDAAAIDAIHQQLTTTFTLPLAYAPQRLGDVRAAEAFSGLAAELLLPELCENEGCADPNDHCVTVPEQTMLCGQFVENRDANVERNTKLQLDLTPGSFVIPNEVGTTPATLIAGGRFGPDRTQVTVPGPGRIEIQDINGFRSRVYIQALQAGPDDLEVRWDISVGSDNQLILRQPDITQLYPYGSINGAMNNDDRFSLRDCDGLDLSLYFIEGTTTEGDAFRLEYRHSIPFAGSGPLILTGAEVMLGGQRAVVTDYFQLIYAGEHHNWNNQFVVVFDQPLTYAGHDVYGIWIDEAAYTCCPVDGVFTIGADYQQLDRLPIQSYARSPVFN